MWMALLLFGCFVLARASSLQSTGGILVEHCRHTVHDAKENVEDKCHHFDLIDTRPCLLK